MDLGTQYDRKKKTIEEVLALIQDGDYMLSAQAMAEPVSLLEKMPLLKKMGTEGTDLQFLHAYGRSALVS